MLEIFLDNRDGRVWDISDLVAGLTWTTVRVGRPASVEFSIVGGEPGGPPVPIHNGDVVRIRKDGTNVFYGYVFALKQRRGEPTEVRAYDQVRYMLNKAAYVFKNATAGDVVRRIAADFGLRTGRIDDTGYRLTMREDNQTLLDVVEKAITLTIHNTGRFYVFFDDFGALSLRDVREFEAGFYVGDGSLMTGFEFDRDIDSDTYNRIKLYRDNPSTGRRDVYMAQDSANIARWGVLQLYRSVDGDKNDAQIAELLDRLAALKNRETKKLRLEAIGDVRVRAGMYLPVVIESLGINQPMMVDEAKHRFDGADHTMSITLKVI